VGGVRPVRGDGGREPAVQPDAGRLPIRDVDADLQTQLDRERTGVFVTQLLFLLVIAALVLARLG
jgi:hypothetical protein